MCLYINHRITKNIRKKMQDAKVFYKNVSVIKKGEKYYISSPYWKTRINAGVYNSDRKDANLNWLEKRNQEVNKGIHVFNNLNGAGRNAGDCNSGVCGYFPGHIVTIEVTAKMDDFVVAGYFETEDRNLGSSVFTKIYISQEQINKAIVKVKKAL